MFNKFILLKEYFNIKQEVIFMGELNVLLKIFKLKVIEK
jgi:hypothetical protein